MEVEVLMLVILGILILSFAIYNLINKKETNGKSNVKNRVPVKSTKKSLQKKDSYKGSSEKESLVGLKKNTKVVPRKDMSEFILFDKVENDMIYQRKGSRYTMVLQCKGLNYELMSDMEQLAVEEGFITFLNTLTFPIQFYIQTRSINLSDSVDKYKQRVEGFAITSKEADANFEFVQEDIDADVDDIRRAREEKARANNLYEYVEDITKYVEMLSINKYMLQRQFYIVLSYNKSDLVGTETFDKNDVDDLCYRELYTRAQGLMGSLMACSVKSKILVSEELAELLYIALNRDDSRLLDIRKALDAGVFRLYTSAEDVREKRQKELDEAIAEESLTRIEEALRKAIDDGIIVSGDEIEETVDKEIDKSAMKMIEKSNVDEKIKDNLKETLLKNRKERNVKRAKVRKEELEEYKKEQEAKLRPKKIDEEDEDEDEKVLEEEKKDKKIIEEVINEDKNEDNDDEEIV